MMTTMEELPHTIRAWERHNPSTGATKLSVHSPEKALSVSELSLENYFSLQILWALSFVDSKFQTLITPLCDELAQKHLELPFWNSYINSFRETVSTSSEQFLDIGCMTIVRYYQLLCCTPKGSEEATTQFFQTRTRPQTRRCETSNNSPTARISDLQVQEQFPEIMKIIRGLSPEIVDPSISRNPHYTSQGILDRTSASSSLLFSKRKDEQITNAALVLLLSSLVAFTNIDVEWTTHKKPFPLRFPREDIAEYPPYEAHFDGYLKAKKENFAKIIFGTKSTLRFMSLRKLQMEESALMAAWICNEPNKVEHKNQKFRRLIISQNWHEIYVMVGEYDVQYISYITGNTKEAGKAFLRMTQIGPYVVNDSEDMSRLGRILLGYIYQECS